MKEETLIKNHGVFGILLKPITDIKRQANKCARQLKKLHSSKLDVSVKEDVSEIGGGSLSTEELPTFVIAVKSKQMSIQELTKKLRQHRIPVYGRLSEDTLLLDFRTVLKGEEKIIIEAFNEILKRK